MIQILRGEAELRTSGNKSKPINKNTGCVGMENLDDENALLIATSNECLVLFLVNNSLKVAATMTPGNEIYI